MLDSLLSGITFLSTLPAWGATSVVGKRIFPSKFLSTLPAWGATPGNALWKEME